MLRGDSTTQIQIGYRDSLDNAKTITLERKYTYDNWFAEFTRIPTLGDVPWKKWNCDVGYVNMGILKRDEADFMYDNLKNTKAIIFDLRKYPEESVIVNIANLILPSRRTVAAFMIPDVTYPGTHSGVFQNSDSRPIPTGTMAKL